MQKQSQNRRRNYFIDKSFQAKFIIKFCVLIIMASLLTAILIYFCNRQTTTVAFENLRIVVKTTADFILPMTLQILAIITLVTALATIVVTLLTSHKIAGPVYRFHKELEKIKCGDLSTPIRIRAKDQLQKVAYECEELRVELKRHIHVIKECWDAIEKQTPSLAANASDEAEKKKITESIDKINAELARFKTE